MTEEPQHAKQINIDQAFNYSIIGFIDTFIVPVLFTFGFVPPPSQRAKLNLVRVTIFVGVPTLSLAYDA